MFGRRFRLFELFGFAVHVDLSWVFLAALIIWTLATGLFPHSYPDLASSSYWWMAAAAALGLFASIVLHEMSHSIVARRYGIPMRGITLFIFGGVAEMNDEPPSPKSEFVMAIAGPIASYLLAGILFAVAAAFAWPRPLSGVLEYLVWINAVLATFNMVPAFPLDGGRVLRSALWAWKKNLRRATRIASRVGTGFAFFLIALGVLAFFTGNVVGGFWWILIGLFIRGASQQSYQQLLVRQALADEPVERFMNRNPITVPPDTPIARLVEDYIYEHHFKMFPVVDDGRLVGCVTTRDVKQLPRDQWQHRTVGDIARTCAAYNTISPGTSAIAALTGMNRHQVSRLLVADGDRLHGIVALRDLVSFLALKLDMEEDKHAALG
jgi:Zn-dependent protease/CBS domain-containing protein